MQGLPLQRLHIYVTAVTDLRPLKDMPLVEIRFNPANITQGMEVVKEIKTLQTIGIEGERAWTPAEFWQRLEMGEFKK